MDDQATQDRGWGCLGSILCFFCITHTVYTITMIALIISGDLRSDPSPAVPLVCGLFCSSLLTLGAARAGLIWTWLLAVPAMCIEGVNLLFWYFLLFSDFNLGRSL